MHANTQAVRAKLENAFVALRGLGYFCAADHTCCNTCGWYEMPDHMTDHAVFYHQQAAESLEETGDCYLTWDGDPKVIRAALEAAGLAVDHDGTHARKFKVSLPVSN